MLHDTYSVLFNFWRISAYFRRSWFCSRRLSIFKPGTKIQSDFCPRLLFSLKPFTKKLLFMKKKTLKKPLTFLDKGSRIYRAKTI